MMYLYLWMPIFMVGNEKDKATELEWHDTIGLYFTEKDVGVTVAISAANEGLYKIAVFLFNHGEILIPSCSCRCCLLLSPPLLYYSAFGR